MKKFLSLVLAMIMTLSLVTISAGATEYKDLTDKDEIQYEEAVAVLNRIGVITGYEDGTFRPETELTRGAAAKIIVSLMIGPDAAGALSNNTSPYPDVPAGHTFAGVISFCKTKNYISGYGDGTFRPTGTLTGYAFAKMLLGALGYSSDIEGFTGTGWTNNVAEVGNLAQLFDRISFDGAAAVNRDQACQLALNTLKATMVEYKTTTMVGPGGNYIMQGEATPKTSNNRDINANIGRKDWYGGNNKGSDYLTLEFGEEHFKDLRLEHDRFDPAHDDFGRPSNEWSYKKVTIGTFPLAADFTYTTQVAHVEDTDGVKEKALGLRNYDLIADGGYSVWTGWGNTGTVTAINGGVTNLWLNGLEKDEFFAETEDGKYVNKVADIADFTDNGTLVEVYVSDVDADWITDVVVIQTQLMEVKKVGSDYVSLERVEPDARKNASPRGEANTGFNLAPIEVNIEQVKDSNEDCYDILKGLKSGDAVAVIPVTTDNGKTYEAAEVYVPETVSGALTRVDTYGIGTEANKERGAVSITVGGTAYKIADWNDEMWSLKTEDIKATRKDVTLLMDKYGNALKAKDVGSTNDFMVIGNFYQALAGSKICTFVHGWDISGNEVDLNLGSSLKIQYHNGSQSVQNHVLGELVYYTSEGTTGDADYVLRHVSAKGDKIVRDVYTNLERTGSDVVVEDAKADYEIKASNLLLPVVTTLTDAEIKAGDKDTDNHFGESDADYGRTNTKDNGNGYATHPSFDTTNYIDRYYDKGVKFIYVNYVEGDDEVESIEVKSGVQNVSQDELRQAIMKWPAQAAVKDDQVKAVVIKRESNDANINRMLYVTKTLGFKEYDKDTNESFYEVEVAMFTSDGKFVTEQHIIINKDLQIGDFASYTKTAGTKYEDNYYRVKEFTRHNTNPAALRSEVVSTVLSTVDNKMVKHLMELGANATYTLYDGTRLIGDIGDDGVDAEMYKESYVLGGYRGSSTTVPNTVEKANGIIRTDKAEWLNATRNNKWDDIDSVEDLFDRVINDGRANNDTVDVTKGKQTLDNVTLKILLNEKPDSDGFRSAYLIVIAAVDGKTTTVKNDPLHTGYELGAEYNTSWTKNMVKGDKFSVTVADGYTVDLDKIQGAIVIDKPVAGTNYWVFEKTSGTVVIPLIPTGVIPPVDSFEVTYIADGKTVETVTVLSGDKYTFTAPADGSYTVNGGAAVKAAKDQKVEVAITAKTEIVFTSDTVIPPVGDIEVKLCKSAEGDAAAAAVKVEKNEDGTIAVTGLGETGEYKAVVVSDGKRVSDTDLDGSIAYVDGAVVYIQKAVDIEFKPSDTILGGIEIIQVFQDDVDFDGIITGIQEQLLLNAPKAGDFTVKTTTYLKVTSDGKDFTIAIMIVVKADGTRSTVLLGKVSEIADLTAALTKNYKDHGNMYTKSEPAEKGFVNVKSGDAVNSIDIPLEEGKEAVNVDNDFQGNVSITAKEDATKEYKIGDQVIGKEPIELKPTDVIDEGDPIVVEKVKLTVNGENVTVKVNGADYTLGEAVEVNKGSEVTLVISPLEGYVIKSVTGAAEGENDTYTLTADNDRIVDVVTESAALAGLPVELTAVAQSTATGIGSVKVSAIQDENVAVTFDEAANSFKVTGDLKLKLGWTEWASNENSSLRDGYFVALKLDWSKGLANIAKVSLTTTKDGEKETTGPVLYDGSDRTGKNEVIIGRVADKTGKMSINRAIVIDYVRGGQDVYEIDFSGLKCPAPELVEFSAVTGKDLDRQIFTGDSADKKKASDIQTGVTVEVTGTDTAKTVKVSGELIPVAKKWAAFGAGDMGAGYMLAINMKWDSSLVDALNARNAAGKKSSGSGDVSGATITKVDCPAKEGETTNGIMVIRVSDLKKTVAPSVVVTAAGKAGTTVTYTFDFTDLKMPAAAGLSVTPTKADTKLEGFGTKTVPELQKDDVAVVDLGNGTFKVTGTLHPVALPWNEFNDSVVAKQTGYYVVLDFDGTAAGQTVRALGPDADTIVPTPSNIYKDWWIIRVADLDEEGHPEENGSVQVWDSGNNTSTPSDTYILDFSGLTLEPVEDFEIVEVEKAGSVSSFQIANTLGVNFDGKTIKISGELRPIEDETVESVMGSEKGRGYFVMFGVNKLSNNLTKFKACGPEGVYGNPDGASVDSENEVVLRVATLTKPEVTEKGRLDLEIGGEWVSYEIDFSGVTFAPRSSTPAPEAE